MLERPSPAVGVYLDRATNSRDMAKEAASENLRQFHSRMEASWMRLAAGTAMVERVDLFLHTIGRDVPPCDTCPRCCRLMRLTMIETDSAENNFSFECTACAFTARRNLRP